MKSMLLDVTKEPFKVHNLNAASIQYFIICYSEWLAYFSISWKRKKLLTKTFVGAQLAYRERFENQFYQSINF